MHRDQAIALLMAFVNGHSLHGVMEVGVLRSDDGQELDLAAVADALQGVRENTDGAFIVRSEDHDSRA